MSLNWNVSRCDDWEGLTDNQPEYDKTRAIVFATMHLGLGSITGKNYKKFYQRLLIVRRTFDQQGKITLEDVRKRIGLTTNSKQLSDAAFRKEVGRWWTEWAEEICSWEEQKEKSKKKEVNDG